MGIFGSGASWMAKLGHSLKWIGQRPWVVPGPPLPLPASVIMRARHGDRQSGEAAQLTRQMP